jgi:soluble cytochrome b562
VSQAQSIDTTSHLGKMRRTLADASKQRREKAEAKSENDHDVGEKS